MQPGSNIVIFVIFVIKNQQKDDPFLFVGPPQSIL